MTYNVIWKPKALKFLGRLDKGLKLRVLKRVDLLREEPFRYLGHFEGILVLSLGLANIEC